MEVADVQGRLKPGCMISALFQMLFGCAHKRISRPITPASKPGVPPADTYVVCLDCGEHFVYDWKEMRMGERIDRPRPQTW